MTIGILKLDKKPNFFFKKKLEKQKIAYNE